MKHYTKQTHPGYTTQHGYKSPHTVFLSFVLSQNSKIFSFLSADIYFRNSVYFLIQYFIPAIFSIKIVCDEFYMTISSFFLFLTWHVHLLMNPEWFGSWELMKNICTNKQLTGGVWGHNWLKNTNILELVLRVSYLMSNSHPAEYSDITDWNQSRIIQLLHPHNFKSCFIYCTWEEVNTKL